MTGTGVAKITNSLAATASTAYFGVNNGSRTFSGVLQDGAGSIAVNKVGTGTVTLTGTTNIYSGGTTIANGTLVMGAAGSLPTGSLVFGGSGTAGTLDLGGQTLGVTGLGLGTGAVWTGQTIGNSSTTAAATLAFNGTSTFGGTIKDALGAGTKTTALTVSGSLTLTGANTYTGVTTVNAASTLRLGDGVTTNGAVTGNLNLGASNAAVVFANPAGQTYAGAISGSGSLTKQGSGVLSLTAPQTYSGATTVSAGTLALTGTQATSGVTMADGTTLTSGGSLVVKNLASVPAATLPSPSRPAPA